MPGTDSAVLAGVRSITIADAAQIETGAFSLRGYSMGLRDDAPPASTYSRMTAGTDGGSGTGNSPGLSVTWVD